MAWRRKTTSHYSEKWWFYLPMHICYPRHRIQDMHRTINSLRRSGAYMCQQHRPSLVQIIACRLFDAKPLSEPMLEHCQMDTYEQTWVKFFHRNLNIFIYKMRLKMSTAKWRPFRLSLDSLITHNGQYLFMLFNKYMSSSFYINGSGVFFLFIKTNSVRYTNLYWLTMSR